MLTEEEYKEYEDWLGDLYDSPLGDTMLLNALQNCGVDSWEGYEFALDCYHEYAEEYYIENVKGTNNNVA